VPPPPESFAPDFAAGAGGNGAPGGTNQEPDPWSPAVRASSCVIRSGLSIPVLVSLAWALVGCGGSRGGSGLPGYGGPAPDQNPGLPPYVSLSPDATGDGWATSTPIAEGLDPQVLTSVLDDIRRGLFPGVDAMIVVRNQRLVAEGYFNGYGRDSIHDLRSTGKSFTSALTGIAVDQGLVSIDDPIAQHIPGFEGHANMDDRKRAITLRHLLHMSSGLECNDWSTSSPGNEERMYGTRDWIGFVLDLRMIASPGTLSTYCTGGVVVLGHVLSLRSGMALDDYAQAWLFDPLDIEQSTWRRSPDGRATGGGGLRLRPRDAAKLGALFANEGLWNGTRVVPENWVMATRARVTALGPDDYGYLWWKRSFAHPRGSLESSFTSGNGGNFIFTFPQVELVVAFTGSNYNDPRSQLPFQIVPRVLAALADGN
jgi:CubicO group peptidase (beta-lactamase class C family)